MMGKSAVPVQIVMFIVYLMKNSSMYLKNYEEKNPKLYTQPHERRMIFENTVWNIFEPWSLF